MGMTREAMDPILSGGNQMGQSLDAVIAGGEAGNPQGAGNLPGTVLEKGNAVTWDCVCGARDLTGKFCPECGAKRPEPVKADTWDCACGASGLTGKFCPECGAKRPEKIEDDTWDCVCGTKGIKSKFCPECGRKRPETSEGEIV